MSNTTDGGNTAIGSDALINNTSGGGDNTAIGDQALLASTTGGLNTSLGFAAGANITSASNTICIGADGENVSNSCYIGNIFGATSATGVVSSSTQPVSSGPILPRSALRNKSSR